ncbi:hypothetical protein D3C75_1228330 [compost metagenome]
MAFPVSKLPVNSMTQLSVCLMSLARLCFVLGSAEIFLCCSKTVGAFGLVGVVEQAERAITINGTDNNILEFICF